MGVNGRVVLLSVMGRDVLPVCARKKLGLESGICDLQPGSQADFFVAASIKECFADSATAAKAIKLRNTSTAEETLVCMTWFQGRQCTWIMVWHACDQSPWLFFAFFLNPSLEIMVHQNS